MSVDNRVGMANERMRRMQNNMILFEKTGKQIYAHPDVLPKSMRGNVRRRWVVGWLLALRNADTLHITFCEIEHQLRAYEKELRKVQETLNSYRDRASILNAYPSHRAEAMKFEETIVEYEHMEKELIHQVRFHWKTLKQVWD